MIEPIKGYDDVIVTSALRMTDEPRLHPIPSDLILNKVITGWGATYSELLAHRHSIILLPHKSQINNKFNAHVNKQYVIRVYESVTTQDIIKHLANRGERWVKFLCTPESLYKIVNAIFRCAINPYKTFFCFCDEFHKITMDVEYRINISSFIDVFLKFENKAMVSATPFKPSDPRFKKWQMWKVKHESREVRKNINLLLTNNTPAAFKEYIENFKGETLFIFFNTLEGIKSLIDLCDLQGTSHIYCSEDGVRRLFKKDEYTVFNDIDPNNIASFNFLTSSFFNGLDISLIGAIPHVLIISDYKYRDFTICDPNTDIYQILGRFRPTNFPEELNDRYADATHMVNIRHSSIVKLRSTVIDDIILSKNQYETICDLQNAATDQFIKEFYNEGKSRITPWSNLLTNGRLDCFKLDNHIYRHQLKECYGHRIALPLAYEMSSLFNVTEQHKTYLPEEFEKMTRSLKRYCKQNIMECCALYTEALKHEDDELLQKINHELKRSFPLVYDAIHNLGIEVIAACDFKLSAIRKALIKFDIQNKLNHHALLEVVYGSFKVGISYPTAKVKLKLQEIFDEFEVGIGAKSTDIESYFKVSEFTGHIGMTKKEIKEMKETQSEAELDTMFLEPKKSVRMYRILEAKYNMIDLHSNRNKKAI